jgi:hypothetical protein
MAAVADRHGKESISDRTDRALGSAAGALSYADGADDVFEMSDADVGRLIKQKAMAFKRAIGRMKDQRSRRPALTEPASLELPIESSNGERPTPDKGVMDEAGRAYRQRLVAGKKLMSSGDMQKALGFTRQALSAAIKTSRMFTVEVDGQTYYPSFFADGDVDRAVLEKISRMLGSMPGWLKWDFFTAARGSLGDMSPLEALRKGKVAEVERIAQAEVEEMAL